MHLRCLPTSRIILYVFAFYSPLLGANAERTKLSQPQQMVVASDGRPARSSGSWIHDKRYYVTRYLDIFSRGVGKKWA